MKRSVRTFIFLAGLLLIVTNSFAWEINNGGIDGILLGKKIPAQVLKGEKTKYESMIADFQPIKGYIFRSPPVRVGQKSGLVDTIIIEDAAVKTREGVGVGSTFKEIIAAHKNVSLNPVPPTLGGDEAVAVSKEIPNVKFYFKDMKEAGNGGRVVRIMIFKE